MIETFTSFFIAMYVGHLVGDYWVQTSWQAENKSDIPFARLMHVLTLQATKAVFVFPLLFIIDVHPIAVAGMLLLDGLSHYIIDDRKNLRKLADLLNKGKFYDLGTPPLAHGAHQLDQSAHIVMIFVVTLMVAIFG